MSDQASRMITVLRAGNDELAARVKGMSPADLTRRSGAAEWDVSQVLSHLGSGAEIGLATLQATLQGSASPDMEHFRSVWARWDAMAPEERAAQFLRANEALVSAYEDLDGPTRTALRIDLGFLPAPVDLATATALRLNEFALHTWDVEVAFDPAAELAAAAAELLTDVDRLGMIIGFLGRADQVSGPIRLTVRLTGSGRTFGLDLGDAVSLSDPPERADGTLVAPDAAWLRLVAGRLAAEYTPPTVQLAGDALTLEDLRRVFPGF